MNLKTLYSILISLIIPLGLFAKVAPEEDEAERDRNLREGTVYIEDDDDIDIPIPDFISTSANVIELNGADWSKVRQAIKDIDNKRGTFSIVHIGDSHLQADIGTGVTRELLQFDYGDAGRGLITPLKMSGTNEPRDYFFTSTGNWSAVKLMRRPWARTMGFTGTSIHPNSESSSFTVGTSEKDDYRPFSSMIIFHKGAMRIKDVVDEDGRDLQATIYPSTDFTQVFLSKPVTRATVRFNSDGDLSVFGVSLSGDRPGLFYHVIGNNGATYQTYNMIDNEGEGLKPLKPNLVIISMGGNEAFGRLDTEGFYKSIDRLVKNISAANPDAAILLVTPMECRRGSRNGSVNTNVKPLRDTILKYGKDNSIAVYDWYDVAGGDGASANWVRGGLFSDYVHHSAKGYNVQGRLMYEALINEFDSKD